ncbi:hypothetical protein GCM10023094_53930 [Rhodococcus olei]|uniref:Uncharacterized protein n=1 Tax=Rhodococcus olei TaxID=2161675 RepID=A0ABP8PQ32_9NOCA
MLTSLGNETQERDERVAVVVDDWHRVSSTATLGAMEFVIDSGCHHPRLSSRAEAAPGSR